MSVDERETNHLKHSYTHEYRLVILEHHLDLFGHVNNAAYLEIFEEARWDLVTRNGYGLDEVQRTRKGPVILEVDLKFLRELRLREEVTIHTGAERVQSRVGTIHQCIMKKDGTVACQAKFLFGLFDLEKRRLIPPTKEWQRAIGQGDA
ncbi:MAG: acyl-CoA thioesterase [Bdellovibrio sp.]|nr:MAG: acyl-CoA thioesterase [Bdellovibrio sp.]